MKHTAITTSLLAVATLSGALWTPLTANAQDWRDREYHRRQQTKNEWRNIAYGAGALSVLGLLNHDDTLTFGGAAGALYAYSRYDHDRRSQDRLERGRSAYFSRTYFYRDGVRYDRRTVWRDGEKYYQFRRHDRDDHYDRDNR